MATEAQNVLATQSRAGSFSVLLCCAGAATLLRVTARFEDGKIVEHWGSSDELGILKQLGVTP